MNRAGSLLAGLLVLTASPMHSREVSGRFIAEKQRYLVGEPIFVNLDLVNNGENPVGVTSGSCWMDLSFEAPTAKPTGGVNLFGCKLAGIAGDCAESLTTLDPGQHLTKRFLVEGPFRLDSPGTFPIHAKTSIRTYPYPLDFSVSEETQIRSDLEITLEVGNQEQLVKAYAPILSDLNNLDFERHSLAVRAVVQQPPSFLEEVILKLADDPKSRGASVDGLKRLGTKAAKDKLLKLASPGNRDNPTQQAIQALGETGDPNYCPALLDLAEISDGYARMVALRAAGYLCGEKALPIFTRLLPGADDDLRFELSHALGNTESRKAIPVLIQLLTDRNENVREAAADGLLTLTHRQLNPGVESPEDAIRTRFDWENWWQSRRRSAKIFGLQDCDAVR